MLITKEQVLDILYKELENTPLDYHNTYTLDDSRAKRKMLLKIIILIENL